MQLILFFTIFAFGLAQEKNIYDKKDNILLAADAKKLPSTENNYVPKFEDDGIDPVNLEQILRELRTERTKNRDLNQTISDILDEMEDMKKNIMRNGEKITDNQSSVFLLTRDVEEVQEEVDGVQQDVAIIQDAIVSVAADVEKNSGLITEVSLDVESNSANIINVLEDMVSLTSSDQQQSTQLLSLSTRGMWCSSNLGPWNRGHSTITYNNLTIYDSNNMDINETPLNISTGTYFYKCVLMFQILIFFIYQESLLCPCPEPGG